MGNFSGTNNPFFELNNTKYTFTEMYNLPYFESITVENDDDLINKIADKVANGVRLVVGKIRETQVLLEDGIGSKSTFNQELEGKVKKELRNIGYMGLVKIANLPINTTHMSFNPSRNTFNLIINQQRRTLPHGQTN